MLNRRILRIKVFKAVYTYAENPGMTLKELQAFFEKSCESTRDLYIYLLAVAGPLTGEGRARIEASMNKFSATEEERNPNMKFVSNRIAGLLSEDPDFVKAVSRRKLDWGQYDVFLRNLYESVRGKDWFKAYLSSGEDGLAEDAALWKRIFEEEFEDNVQLEEILEDLSILWNDDLVYALNWCCRTMDELGRGERWSLPPLYQSELTPGRESDKAFAVKLLTAAYNGFGAYRDMVAASAPKWDSNRICATDLALIVCGLAEREHLGTPVGVTINEYVEISKFYSTPESRSFVNGLLDRLINKKQ